MWFSKCIFKCKKKEKEMNSVLIVEDNKDMQFLLSNILKEAGIKTVIAENAPTALQEIEKIIPDLVLLDIQLPGMNGFEILEKIKQKYEDIYTIMITAYSSIASRARAMALGANDYISKPFNNDELIFKIRNGLEKSSSRVVS